MIGLVYRPYITIQEPGNSIDVSITVLGFSDAESKDWSFKRNFVAALILAFC